jgi:hypothetical protein
MSTCPTCQQLIAENEALKHELLIVGRQCDKLGKEAREDAEHSFAFLQRVRLAQERWQMAMRSLQHDLRVAVLCARGEMERPAEPASWHPDTSLLQYNVFSEEADLKDGPYPQ